MKIIIMRHGQATLSNNDQVLTNKGILESTKVAEEINRKYKITRAFISPKTRAQQTAHIVLSKVQGEVIREILPELVPQGDPLTFRAYLDAVCNFEDVVLIVSHLPLVSELCYEFTSHQDFGPDFVTSSAFLLDYNGEIAIPEHFFKPQNEYWYN